MLPSNPASADPRSLSTPQPIRDAIVDQLLNLKDVQHAFDALEILVDPPTAPGAVLLELERQQIGALVRMIRHTLEASIVDMNRLIAVAQANQ